MNDNLLIESLCRYIGQTVTIFTTSGGLSGCGFTGVLAAITDTTVKLITDIGAAPTCPVGSTCGGCGNNNCGCNGNNRGGYGNYGRFGGYGSFGGFGGFGNFGGGYGGSCGGGCGNNCGCGCENECNNNWLGSVTEIPICKIASFTHNAI